MSADTARNVLLVWLGMVLGVALIALANGAYEPIIAWVIVAAMIGLITLIHRSVL